MQSTAQFSLTQSGAPFIVLNSALLDSSSLSVSYTIAGSPTSLTITVEGGKNSAGGIVQALDTYVGTGNTTRTISLPDTYGYFVVTATWTGGQNVSIAASMNGSGPGIVMPAPTFATVGTSSAQVLPQNINRKGLVLVNTSVNTISVSFGSNPAIAGSGITLGPNGGAYTMTNETFTTLAVNAIASSAGSNLSIQELA